MVGVDVGKGYYLAAFEGGEAVGILQVPEGVVSTNHPGRSMEIALMV